MPRLKRTARMGGHQADESRAAAASRDSSSSASSCADRDSGSDSSWVACEAEAESESSRSSEEEEEEEDAADEEVDTVENDEEDDDAEEQEQEHDDDDDASSAVQDLLDDMGDGSDSSDSEATSDPLSAPTSPTSHDSPPFVAHSFVSRTLYDQTVQQLNERIRELEEKQRETADQTSASSSSPRCAFTECGGVATSFCSECGEVCSEHSSGPLHADGAWSQHERVPIASKAELQQRRQQALHDSKAEEIREQLDRMSCEADEVKEKIESISLSQWSGIDSRWSSVLAFESHTAELIRQWKGELTLILGARDTLAQRRTDLTVRMGRLVDQVKSLKALPSSRLLMRIGTIDHVELVKLRKDQEQLATDTTKGSPKLQIRHPAEDALAALQPTSVMRSLSTVSTEMQSTLQGFLGRDVPLGKARLLYRASRDGWLPADYFTRCARQGPTLTIVKAAGTGFVFGAYTAVSWPVPTKQDVHVPDPTGRSFLFSLTNAYDRPFRMSLVDRARAVSLDTVNGPSFSGQVRSASGGLTHVCALVLMNGGRAGNSAAGNFSNKLARTNKAYRLDMQEATMTPATDGFELDNETLAGAVRFAAVEIECYAM